MAGMIEPDRAPKHIAMSMTQNRLLTLLDLAQESSHDKDSSEKRRQLLREIADLYLDKPEAYSAGETAQFGDIMGHIVHDVEMELRKSLAERLAGVPHAPHSLIMQLANDEIAVAQPILTRSAVLQDEDLVHIAERRGQDHLRAMARRDRLSPLVTDAIVRRGDDTVVETLVANAGATFSREGIETVAARAEANERLAAPLVSRADLPPDVMHQMFFSVGTKLRAFILERTAGLDPQVLDQALADAERRASRRMRIAQRLPSSAEQFIADKEAKRQLNEQLLVALLRARQLSEFLAGFARLTGLDPVTAKRIVSDETGEGLAIACRAARFERSTFSTIVLLANPAQKRSTAETQALLGLYDRVNHDAAQRVMRFWKVRREALRAEPAHPTLPSAAAAP